MLIIFRGQSPYAHRSGRRRSTKSGWHCMSADWLMLITSSGNPKRGTRPSLNKQGGKPPTIVLPPGKRSTLGEGGGGGRVLFSMCPPWFQNRNGSTNPPGKRTTVPFVAYFSRPSPSHLFIFTITSSVYWQTVSLSGLGSHNILFVVCQRRVRVEVLPITRPPCPSIPYTRQDKFLELPS